MKVKGGRNSVKCGGMTGCEEDAGHLFQNKRTTKFGLQNNIFRQLNAYLSSINHMKRIAKDTQFYAIILQVVL